MLCPRQCDADRNTDMWKVTVASVRNATRMRHLVRGAGLPVCLLLIAGPALAQSSVPDPTRTPGALNPDVTQDTIASTICVRGWTATVRPPEAYTHGLKHRQIAAFGYADRRIASYVEDHLVPLSLGGAPYDPRNLWPQPRVADDGWTSDMKDELEAVLPRLVCAGKLSLDEARRAIAADWRQAYRRCVAP